MVKVINRYQILGNLAISFPLTRTICFMKRSISEEEFVDEWMKIAFGDESKRKEMAEEFKVHI